jgi:hypothetical protein
MLKQDVYIGRIYIAKVSNKEVLVRIINKDPYGGWNARNLKTKRVVKIKTGGRLRPVKTVCEEK